MQYFIYYIVAMTVAGVLATIAQVGKRRAMVTPGAAALTAAWGAANDIGYIWILGAVK